LDLLQSEEVFSIHLVELTRFREVGKRSAKGQARCKA
jgi:hypothetical protein